MILFSSNACFCGVKFWIVIEFKEEFCSAHAPEIPTHNNTNTTHTNICICGACSTAIVNASNLLLLCEVLIFMFACWFVFKACACVCVRVPWIYMQPNRCRHVCTCFNIFLFVFALASIRTNACLCSRMHMQMLKMSAEMQFKLHSKLYWPTTCGKNIFS